MSADETLLRLTQALESFTRPATITVASPSTPVEGKGDGLDPLVASVAANTFARRGAELVARARRRLDGLENPIPTPWPSINRRMGGGLWPGMHVLVGGTGTGKSQWALQVAMDAARAGVPVLVLSLELDALGIFARAVSHLERESDSQSKLRWSSIYTGTRGDERADQTEPRVRAALDRWPEVLSTLPFHWVEAPPHGLPHTRIVELVAALRAAYPDRSADDPVLVIVDFLQIVAGEDPQEDSVSRVSRAAYQCRQVARDHNAVVLVLSSTSRENVKLTVVDDRSRADPPPRAREPAHALVGLGKESGDVEYSADSVAVLCRETYAEGSAPMQGGRPVWCAVAKVRAGAAGWHELRFDGSRFIEAPAIAPAEALVDDRAFCVRCDETVRVEWLQGQWQCGSGHETDAPLATVAPVPLVGPALRAAEKQKQEAEKEARAKARKQRIAEAQEQGDELVRVAQAEGRGKVDQAKIAAEKLKLDSTAAQRAEAETNAKALVLKAESEAKAVERKARDKAKALVRNAKAS